MPTKPKANREEGNDRLVELLERFSTAALYMGTSLGQADIARILGIGNDRISKILKGLEKPKANAKEKE